MGFHDPWKMLMILFDIVENQKWHYDTVLMERIFLYSRAKSSVDAGRANANFETAMQ